MQKFATTSQVDAPRIVQSCARRLKNEFQLASNVADISLSILRRIGRTMAEKSGATPAPVAEIASQLPIPDKQPMRKDTMLCVSSRTEIYPMKEIQQYIAHLRSLLEEIHAGGLDWNAVAPS